MSAPYIIDALVPWVDGDDPRLQAKRQPYLDPKAARNDDVAGATRYKSIGEIRYCIASILRFAPFIRTIWIMTDGQDPGLDAFLDRNFPDRRTSVRIVDHSVIFKGYEYALPVFNSNAIEAVMWNIPDMAEHILYFNDDFMLTAPVRPEDFFPAEDRVVCFGSWFWAPFERFLRWIKPIQKGRRVIGFKDLMLNALDLMGGGQRFINLGHTPRPLLKNWFEKWAVQRPDMVALNLKGRFREPFHFQAQEPFYLDMARQGRVTLVPEESKTLYFKRRDARDYVARKLAAFDASDKPFACFNSLDYCTEEEQQQVLTWLRKRLQVREV